MTISSSRGGAILVKGSPDKSVTIAELAGGGTFHGKSEDVPPDGPEAPAEGCVGRLGLESFHAPQLIAHAVRVKVDRGTGVVRVLRSRPRTTAARSSTGSVPTDRSTAAS